MCYYKYESLIQNFKDPRQEEAWACNEILRLTMEEGLPPYHPRCNEIRQKYLSFGNAHTNKVDKAVFSSPEFKDGCEKVIECLTEHGTSQYAFLIEVTGIRTGYLKRILRYLELEGKCRKKRGYRVLAENGRYMERIVYELTINVA